MRTALKALDYSTDRIGVVACSSGGEYGPYGEAAWTILYLDGGTGIVVDDDLALL